MGGGSLRASYGQHKEIMQSPWRKWEVGVPIRGSIGGKARARPGTGTFRHMATALLLPHPLTLSSSPPVLHLPSVWCLPQAPRWALSIGRTWYNHTEESSDRPVCDPVIYSCWCRHTLLVALWRWRHHNLLPF